MRSAVIDVVKGIAILMIVNVHLIGGPCFTIGNTYHVIAFFGVSGVLLGMNPKWNILSFKEFVYQRAKRLMYPYLTLSICYLMFRIAINIMRGDVVFNDVIINAVISTFTLRGIGTLWFFPIFFIGEIVFFGLHRKHAKEIVVTVIGLSAVVLSYLLNSNGICGIDWYGATSTYGLLINTSAYLILASIIASLFMEFGYLIYKMIPTAVTQDIIGENKKILFYTITICAVSFFIDFLLHDKYVGDLHKLDIGNPAIYLICSISGLTFVFTLSILICHTLKRITKALSYIGRNSIIVMTTHSEYMLNSVAYMVVSYLVTNLNIVLDSPVASFLSLCLIVIMEIVIIRIVNSTPLKFIYKVPFNS